jgi:3-oxoacyl-[acyl-carrier-protein] synthase-3
VEQHVGIIGIGTYLPPEVRANDWWPQRVVDAWMEARKQPMPPPAAVTDGMRRVMAAMAQQAIDPFQGVTHRHVMPEAMTSTDMEREAAERALAHAGIDRGQIDLLFTHTAVPEYLMSNTACVLHQALGLPADCFTMQAEAAGYSFMMQLTLAEQMIASGRARYALLVQSAAGSRLLDIEDPQSPLFGDGAAAVVIGPVPGRSIVATVHRTDGRHPRSLIASVRGKRWYEDGPIVLHRGDLFSARQVFLETADRMDQVISAVLDRAGFVAGEVEFFAIHQGTPWMRQVTMETAGLTRARHVDAFATVGYMFGASIPFVLEAGHREGLLEAGQRVLLCGGGVGSTFGAIAMRWGQVRR